MPDIESQIRENVPLAPMTTIGIGGAARWYLAAASAEELWAGARWADKRGVPLFLLGGGSNVVIADEGFEGLVVRNEIRGIESADDGDAVRMKVGAGEEWDPLVERAVQRNFAGIEALSGIPGLVGATPIQNVGAYGQEVSETIVEVEVLHLSSGEIRRLSNRECGFDYRDSVFKREAKGVFAVTRVDFLLHPFGTPALRYPELEARVKEQFGNMPTLAQVREAVIAIRKRKGMVIDPSDPDTRSDGSFFMNPILTAEEHEAFLRKVAEADPALDPGRVPAFPAGNGRVKLSAAWLIEHAGFSKGYGEGRVGLSTKHTLAIVNRGGATAAELLRLVGEIQRTVANRFGVPIRPEPNFIGFDSES